MKRLVVDDDPQLRDALEVGAQSRSEDVQVVTAGDREAGLEQVFNEDLAVVLLDVTMPRMNGFEVLESIRQLRPIGCRDRRRHRPALHTGGRCTTRGAILRGTLVNPGRQG
jgi:CheY-like chemotaxis protein